jgi:hypothetical protein
VAEATARLPHSGYDKDDEVTGEPAGNPSLDHQTAEEVEPTSIAVAGESCLPAKANTFAVAVNGRSLRRSGAR